MSLDEQILKELKKANLTPEERKQLLRQIRKREIRRGNKTTRQYPSKHFRIGVVSDLHIGHAKFRYDIFEDSIKEFNRAKVDEIYIPGDIIEGMSNREGHIYELSITGVTNQVNVAADLIDQYRQPVLAILGNHDLFSVKKGNQGVDVGQMLEERINGFEILGHYSGDIRVGNITIRLSHEGQSAYALSYNLQKRINALQGGTKPNIILNGHLHKALYMFYRNIHALECGTLEDQTDFMRMKGAPAHTGFWILDIHYNKKGITKFQPTFYPYY